MRYVIATYRLRPEKLEEANAAIQAYTDYVQKAEPGTVGYQCLQREDDPTRFVHLMSFPHEEAEIIHATSPVLKMFSEKLLPYCIEGPNYESLRRVGPAG